MTLIELREWVSRGYLREGDAVFSAFFHEDLVEILSSDDVSIEEESGEIVVRGGYAAGVPIVGVRFQLRGGRLFVVGYEPTT